MHTTANANPKADVLIVTVTNVESKAVIQVFREATGQAPQPIPIGERVYHDLGEVNRTHVFMALSEMGAGGLGSSQQAVQKGITALHPSAVIMVGIAFGVDEQKHIIGDVLVSQQLLLYDLQRVGTDKIILRGDKPHASTKLINHFRGAELYWTGANVRFGLILTGEKLVDNVDYRDQLKQLGLEAIGGEMEGAGVYAACQEAHVDWIVVKAICDWADGNKAEGKNANQRLAADNSARFVLHALQKAPLKRDRGPLSDTLINIKRRIQSSIEEAPSIRKLHLDHELNKEWRTGIRRYLRMLDRRLVDSQYVNQYDNIPWHLPNIPADDSAEQLMRYEHACDNTVGILRDAIQNIEEKLEEVEYGE